MKDKDTTREQLTEELIRLRKALKECKKDLAGYRQMDETLKESEKRYRFLFESAPVGIGISDSGGNVVAANKAMQEITGYTMEDWKKNKLGTTYVDANERKRLLKILQDLGKVRDFEVRLKRKDGSIYTALLNVDVVKIGGKKMFFTTARNITRRKEVENALKENEERLNNFMDSATDVFLLLDSKLNIIEINKAGLELIGQGKNDIVGKNIQDFTPDLRESARFDEYMKVIKTGEPFFIDDLVPPPMFGKRHFSLKVFKVGSGLGIIATDFTRYEHMGKQLNKFAEAAAAGKLKIEEMKEEAKKLKKEIKELKK